MQTKDQIFAVFFGHRWGAHIYAGQVDALFFAQRATRNNIGNHLGRGTFPHPQLNQAIRQQNPITSFTILRQWFVGGADAAWSADNFLGCNDELVTGFKLNRGFIQQQAGADFRSLQVL